MSFVSTVCKALFNSISFLNACWSQMQGKEDFNLYFEQNGYFTEYISLLFLINKNDLLERPKDVKISPWICISWPIG